MVNSAFWHDLRNDFETLQDHEFSLSWSTRPPIGILTGEQLPSQWSWWRYPDDSLRVRFEAVAVRGAKALGFKSEDDWLDQLRLSGFAKFGFTGSGMEKRKDGATIISESVALEEVVKHSITLCMKLEAESFPPSDDGKNIAGESVDFWLDLKAGFLTLPNFESLEAVAIWPTGEWNLIFKGSISDPQYHRLEWSFRNLASKAAVALGAGEDVDPLAAWLNELREHSERFAFLDDYDSDDSDQLPRGYNQGWIKEAVLASSEHCDQFARRLFERRCPATIIHAEDTVAVEVQAELLAPVGLDAVGHQTAIGRNIDRLRKECGWTFEELSEHANIAKSLIFRHVNQGKNLYPGTAKRYAVAFSMFLEREVTVSELEREN